MKNLGTLMPKAVSDYYIRTIADSLKRPSLDEIVNGKIIGWRKRKVNKYLEFTVPWIEKHYEEDDFVGYLLVTRRIETKIKIGKKTVEYPIREKPKAGEKLNIIRFDRIGKEKHA